MDDLFKDPFYSMGPSCNFLATENFVVVFAIKDVDYLALILFFCGEITIAATVLLMRIYFIDFNYNLFEGVFYLHYQYWKLLSIKLFLHNSRKLLLEYILFFVFLFCLPP